MPCPSFGILASGRNWLRDFLICLCQRMLLSALTMTHAGLFAVSRFPCAFGVTDPLSCLVLPSCGSVE
ncbi:MAG: hypothetical protein CMN98_09485 [Synechococcus sp. NP17]|nr:hypothetical protein [Synechococcus sp. NP17]